MRSMIYFCYLEWATGEDINSSVEGLRHQTGYSTDSKHLGAFITRSLVTNSEQLVVENYVRNIIYYLPTCLHFSVFHL